ncbi:efflux RND transporter periplasmic adaptor subunit [candidate division WOR-3 bacterium]|nr:efflux RND transporter periplasmic adaptor subunit [candidate division WOR-3 bacterium]
MKKWIFVIGGCIFVIVIIVVTLTQQKGGAEVDVVIARHGEIVSTVTASGELRAQSQVDISAETIARIKRVRFKEGDNVKKGDLLIELDNVRVEANRSLAYAQMQQAGQDLDRARQLFEKELISRESFEKIELSYEAAKAQYEQALDAYIKTRIYAPIQGKIMKINVEEGETAVMGTMNYQGTVLMTIADMSTMIAVVTIDETDVPVVKTGQKVKVIADALPDTSFSGSVTKVGLMPITSQLSTEKVTDFEVEIELKDFSPLLRPGMNVKTDIITNEKNDVLVIPIQASGKRRIDDKTVESVYRVSESKAQLVEVETGVSSDNEIEILSGIEDGDTVIIGPYRILSTLKDGQQVKCVIEEPDSTAEKAASQMRQLKKAIKKRT